MVVNSYAQELHKATSKAQASLLGKRIGQNMRLICKMDSAYMRLPATYLKATSNFSKDIFHRHSGVFKMDLTC